MINTHKVTITQTLGLFNKSWRENLYLVSKFMKGVYNLKPPLPRYTFTWDISVVLNYLSTLFPLRSLSIKDLTFKLCTLMAISTGTRVQTLVALNLKNMCIFCDRIDFVFTSLLKTSKPGRSVCVSFKRFSQKELCVYRTLVEYIKRTQDLRKSDQLIISFATYKSVSTSTLSRYIKQVMATAGIDTNMYKAHSVTGASTSSTVRNGISMKRILKKTAKWTFSRHFYKFYYRDLQPDNSREFLESAFQED